MERERVRLKYLKVLSEFFDQIDVMQLRVLGDDDDDEMVRIRNAWNFLCE